MCNPPTNAARPVLLLPSQGYGALGREMEHLWQNSQPVCNFWRSVKGWKQWGLTCIYKVYTPPKDSQAGYKTKWGFQEQVLDKNKICWGGNKSDEENLLTHSSKYIQRVVGLFLSLLIKTFATLIWQFPSENFKNTCRRWRALPCSCGRRN